MTKSHLCTESPQMQLHVLLHWLTPQYNYAILQVADVEVGLFISRDTRTRNGQPGSRKYHSLATPRSKLLHIIISLQQAEVRKYL